MKNIIIVVIALASLLVSCATICTVPPVKVTLDINKVEMDTSKIPCYKVKEYELAAKYVMQAIFSDQFETRLSDHIKNGIGEGEHKKAWENVNAADVVQKMRVQISGEYVETYGGLRGLTLFWFKGNLAFDGTKSGPILINRIPLKPRMAPSLSNTIAHETAHRIGLTHPHSDTDLKIAFKEPPYVIGDIIQKIVEEKMAMTH